MTMQTNIKQGREKGAAPFVPVYGEKVLTKNVKLSNVKYSLDIYL
jgi:hypothetical protein